MNIEDKLPPHSLEAESGIIGSILLSPRDSMDLCGEKGVNESWFYDLRHGLLFSVLDKMYLSNDFIDLTTVIQRLRNTNQLDSVGGNAYVSSLMDAVPSASGLTQYITIVREKFILRGMLQVCVRTISKVRESENDVDALLEETEKEIQKVSEARFDGGKSRVLEPRESARAFTDDLQRRFELKGALSGIGTGFTRLDKMTSGYQAGELVIIGARPSAGKAQPLHSKILTPTGWTEMGKIKVGDLVIGADGAHKSVLGVFPQGFKHTFRFTMDDGSFTECCGEHLWLTRSRKEQKAKQEATVKTASEISRTLKDGPRNAHCIPYCKPVEFAAIESDISPWLVGMWLGDGSGDSNALIHNPESDIIERIKNSVPESDVAIIGFSSRAGDCPVIRIKRKNRNNKKSDFSQYLESVGLLGKNSFDKFIPESLLLGNVKTRANLLMGLLDADGYVGRRHVEISTASHLMRDGIVHLVRSLGGRCTWVSRDTHYVKNGQRHEASTAYRIQVSFTNGFVPVSSEKHLAKFNRKIPRKQWRFIQKCEYAGPQECQCISVEGGLYITDGFIVTHNTSLACSTVVQSCLKAGVPTAFITCEMSPHSILRRIASGQLRIPAFHLRDGSFSESDFKKLIGFNSMISKSNLHFIDGVSGITIAQISSELRRLVRNKGVKLVIVDYLQKIRPSQSKEKRTYEVGAVSEALKGLAASLGVAMVALAQLNREPDKDKGRQPKASDLADSAQIERDADLIGLIHRIRTEEDPQGAHAKLIIAKQRDGEVGIVELNFNPTYVEFTDVVDID